MTKTAAMTIRLPVELAEDVALVAACDEEATVETIRRALTAWVARRRIDPAFQAALRQHIDKATRLLDGEAQR